jgi:tetratricopeptide (TPR) repeat protein
VNGYPVSIIIPAYNQLDYCRQCIQSILMNTDRPYRLVLVDNGSTDGVGEFFDSISGATVIHTGRNLGFAGGVNRGLEEAEGHVLLLNSDTLVPRGWLGRLENALESAADIGIVGPRSNCVSGSQQIDGLEFTSLDEINAFAGELAAKHPGQLRDVARLVGFCMLIRDEAIQKIGLFDEAYGVGNFEDDDYCLRALRAGYRLCVAEDAFVFHYGSRTFLGMGMTGDAWDGLFKRNEQLFAEKWAVSPEERSDAIQASRQHNRRAREAAETGDWAGALRCFKQAIETAPHDDQNYSDLGVVLWRMGDTDRARGYFQRALRLNPDNECARENLRALGENGG